MAQWYAVSTAVLSLDGLGGATVNALMEIVYVNSEAEAIGLMYQRLQREFTGKGHTKIAAVAVPTEPSTE